MAGEDDLNALVHDAAALFRFIEFICQFCYEQENRQAYPDASHTFFRYITDLGKSTKASIQADVSDAKEHSDVIDYYRTGLTTIKKCWSRIHKFVKQVADGHALQMPTPLLNFMEGQVASIPGLEGARIVILLSEELNYLQYQNDQLKNFCVDLSLTITGAPEFPPKLAFIGIPFSQRTTVFTNTLIYHELGHFAFEELKRRDALNTRINEVLTQRLGNTYTNMGSTEKRWHQDQLAAWCEEAFCDLFALWLIGPAYAFASIELLSLLDVLRPDDAKAFDTAEDPEHPCFAFRFKEHLDQLTAHGWWDTIKDMKCAHPGLIQEIAAIDPAEYTSDPVEPLFDDKLIPAFLLLRNDIRELVKATVANRDCGLNAFKQIEKDVAQCLSVGIVPSVLYKNENRQFVPALINAAFVFYLESVSTLIVNIAEQDTFNLEHRGDITNRLEMWILKAIEDCNLLTRFSDQQHRPGNEIA